MAVPVARVNLFVRIPAFDISTASHDTLTDTKLGEKKKNISSEMANTHSFKPVLQREFLGFIVLGQPLANLNSVEFANAISTVFANLTSNDLELMRSDRL